MECFFSISPCLPFILSLPLLPVFVHGVDSDELTNVTLLFFFFKDIFRQQPWQAAMELKKDNRNKSSLRAPPLAAI